MGIAIAIFPFIMKNLNDELAHAIAKTWPLGWCLCASCASIIERLYPLEYSDRLFIRSGDIRSEPPCLWEFKISKAP